MFHIFFRRTATKKISVSKIMALINLLKKMPLFMIKVLFLPLLISISAISSIIREGHCSPVSYLVKSLCRLKNNGLLNLTHQN
jgi:hypothetical protein